MRTILCRTPGIQVCSEAVIGSAVLIGGAIIIHNIVAYDEKGNENFDKTIQWVSITIQYQPSTTKLI
jgi:hypothetical protein